MGIVRKIIVSLDEHINDNDHDVTLNHRIIAFDNIKLLVMVGIIFKLNSTFYLYTSVIPFSNRNIFSYNICSVTKFSL